MPDCKIHFTGGESIEVLDVVMDEFLEKLEQGGTWWALDDDRLFIRPESITHIEMYERWKPDGSDCWRTCPTHACLLEDNNDCPYICSEKVVEE